MSGSDRELRLASDFMDCIAALNGHGVTYVLVGAHAVGWHGFIRATGDIDFLYRQTESNVNRLCEALRDFGAPPSLIDPAFMMSHEPITQIGVQPLRIDFIATLSGVSFDEVDGGAIATTIDGQPIRVIGLEQLLRNKRSTGRAKDASDVRELESLKRTSGAKSEGRQRGRKR